MVEICIKNSIEKLFLEQSWQKKEEIEIVMNNFIIVYLVIIDNNIFINNYIKPLKSFFISKSNIQKNNNKYNRNINS